MKELVTPVSSDAFIVMHSFMFSVVFRPSLKLVITIIIPLCFPWLLVIIICVGFVEKKEMERRGSIAVIFVHFLLMLVVSSMTFRGRLQLKKIENKKGNDKTQEFYLENPKQIRNPSEKEGEEASITTQIYTLSLDNDEDNSDEEGSHENILKPGVTLQQILESFSESDDAEYQSLVAAMEKASGGGGDDDDDTENEANSEDKHSHYFSYLEKPLYDLIDKLELEDADPFQGFDRDSPTVLVDGGYLVLEKWAGVFTKVFTKYGDISESSNLGIKVRTVVWNLFCKVMEDMSRTKFENVTGEDLVSWMIGIRTIELAGFETEFAFEGWKKIAMAFFGAKAKDVAQELVDEKEEKIKEQRMKLENLCEEQEKLLSLREKCHIEALAMEDGTFVTDGFL
ncbi:Fiber Fb17-like protein [Cucumis melo var. makuwa]|uniref:Fiber Fb17-like protein n=1 Tax=Cucumis melo var. makuwa TaxID=1194695 RepID=A0A5A7TKZ5_CUCMM|nr:Fiber Fb17-like protein [Cucumis melo var. makuwa]